jgi:adenine nucleotide transporter 17
MAKVRIQARNAHSEDASEHNEQLPTPGTHRHNKNKHVGAIAILQRVWKREGFLGWYQVCLLNVYPQLQAH